jgi:hypothetical protein
LNTFIKILRIVIKIQGISSSLTCLPTLLVPK